MQIVELLEAIAKAEFGKDEKPSLLSRAFAYVAMANTESTLITYHLLSNAIARRLFKIIGEAYKTNQNNYLWLRHEDFFSH